MEVSCLCICKILDFGVNLSKSNAMDRIVLEVDDSTAKIYRNFPPESKQQFNQVVSLMLKKAINDASLPDYKKSMDQVGFSAVAAGLTPEILEEILHMPQPR